MILSIITDTNKLSVPSFDVAFPESIFIQEIVKDMIDTVSEYNGLGMAAIQIGKELKIMVVKINDEYIPFINPKITAMRASGISSKLEGCLSFPGRSKIKVRRYKEIIIENYNGEKVKLKGWEARTVQHEADHFRGVLI